MPNVTMTELLLFEKYKILKAERTINARHKYYTS